MAPVERPLASKHVRVARDRRIGTFGESRKFTEKRTVRWSLLSRLEARRS